MSKRTNLKVWGIILLFLVGIWCSAAVGQTIYVDADANGLNDGSSWANAYTELQCALNVAVYADEIWVAESTYLPDYNCATQTHTGDRTATFQLISGVAIYGGFPSGGGSWQERNPNDPNNETILSGDLDGNDVQGLDPCDLLNHPSRAENSYHVVAAIGTDANTILDGFTITAGNADGLPRPLNSAGGGMYNDSSSPMLTNCTFMENSAEASGGIYNYKGNLTLTNCIFTRNFADGAGGGMSNAYGNTILTNCTFAENSAYWGGGMHNYDSNTILTNCTFSENSAGSSGGGMDNGWSNLTLTNCNFIENQAVYGGGVFNNNSSSELNNCTFSNNDANNSGGGIFNTDNSNLEINNCTFSGNSAVDAGGGMNNHESSPVLTNCTFIGNSANHQGGGVNNYESNATLTDCNFVENSAQYGGGISNQSSNPELNNCTFSNNTSIDGGGMNNWQSSPSLTGCTFSGNSANWAGGGLANNHNSNPSLNNCDFADNSASYGGGISNYESYPNLSNCTFSSNIANECGGGMCNNYSSPTVTNCVLWGNTASSGSELYNDGTSSSIVTYSDVQGGWPGIGNIDVDPCFVAPANGDYHLKSEGWSWDIKRNRWTYDDVTSRCIDAGNPGSPLADEPITIPDDPNNEWGENLRINMGAYGGTAEASIPPYDWAILADLTNDGVVNLKDFAAQATGWLETESEQPGDLDRDGTVYIDDLGMSVEDWLKQTSWSE